MADKVAPHIDVGNTTPDALLSYYLSVMGDRPIAFAKALAAMPLDQALMLLALGVGAQGTTIAKLTGTPTLPLAEIRGKPT